MCESVLHTATSTSVSQLCQMLHSYFTFYWRLYRLLTCCSGAVMKGKFFKFSFKEQSRATPAPTQVLTNVSNVNESQACGVGLPGMNAAEIIYTLKILTCVVSELTKHLLSPTNRKSCMKTLNSKKCFSVLFFYFILRLKHFCSRLLLTTHSSLF